MTCHGTRKVPKLSHKTFYFASNFNFNWNLQKLGKVPKFLEQSCSRKLTLPHAWQWCFRLMTVNCESQLAHRFTESGLMSVGGVRPILAPSPDVPAAAPFDATVPPTLSSHDTANDEWGWIGETRNEDLRRVLNQIKLKTSKFIHLTRQKHFWTKMFTSSVMAANRASIQASFSSGVLQRKKHKIKNFIHFIQKIIEKREMSR